MQISIVTPTLNQGAYLKHTARSILDQQGVFDLEWIVIDGGSTDDTLSYLRALDDPRLRFVSERDAGQSDAINKGLAMAGGDVVAWLNSDDLYVEGALASVAEAFALNPDAQWLVGRCDVVDANDREIRHAVTRYKDRKLRRYSYRKLLRENFISQPAVFWRREFGKRIGRLDESLHYTMDYDLWLRMGRVAPPLILDRLLAHFRFHQASKSGQVNRRQFDEGYEVASRHFNDDHLSRWAHRLNIEKIVWAYRLMRFFAR